MLKGLTMAVIRIAFVLIVWLLILSSCSNIPKDIMLVDTNGTKHFHTLQKITNVGESVRFCELHDTWEYVSKR